MGTELDVKRGREFIAEVENVMSSAEDSQDKFSKVLSFFMEKSRKNPEAVVDGIALFLEDYARLPFLTFFVFEEILSFDAYKERAVKIIRDKAVKKDVVFFEKLVFAFLLHPAVVGSALSVFEGGKSEGNSSDEEGKESKKDGDGVHRVPKSIFSGEAGLN